MAMIKWQVKKVMVDEKITLDNSNLKEKTREKEKKPLLHWPFKLDYT